ncbi:MAG: hypothetical protein HDR88_06365 [Bacteroides sp.]|nr:hypothetical protein [Bacteroides sp.]
MSQHLNQYVTQIMVPDPIQKNQFVIFKKALFAPKYFIVDRNKLLPNLRDVQGSNICSLNLSLQAVRQILSILLIGYSIC